MDRPNSKPRSKNNLGLLLRWHRYLGLTVAIFVAILAITGLLLNHTEALGLDIRYVQNEVVLYRYGIEPPQIRSFSAGDHWISKLDDQLYFNMKRIPGHYGDLMGAVQADNWVIVALANQLLIVTQEGKLVENVGPAEGAPGSIGAIALDSDNSLLVKGSHGIYRTGADLLEWRQLTSEATAWSQPKRTPEHLQQVLLQAWRGQTLTWERVILDLHSGRIFGPLGEWIMDLAALLMLVLAATGCYMWWGHRSKRRQ